MPSFKSTKNYDKLNNSKNLDIKNSLLNKTHLTNYLKNYKLFPEKHRLFIWKNILILPENKEAFDNLISRGISKEFCDLYQKYQLTSENLFRKLQRILSALVNYNAAFLQVPFLQDMIFPFIKLFSQNELWCFELILSFFLNWGQHFFEYSPNPPIKYFKCIDEIIKFIDLDFWKFLQSQKISSLNLIWPSFQVLFTDILTKEEWLSFMDYMILNQNKPEILLCFSAIFLLSYKEKLMQDSEIKGLSCYEKSFFMEKQILLVDKLVNQLPEELLELSFKQNLPLLKDQYPIYNFYPLYDLNEHRKMREKIIEEEEKYQQDKNRLDLKKINLFSTKLLKEQESLQENYRAFNRKIDDERDLLSLEQELTLKKQMEVNQALTHDKILKMEQNENVLKRNLQNQIQRREEQKKLLEKDLEFNKKIEDLRIGSTIKKESLNNLEFETFLKLNDLVKKREKSEEKKNLLQNLNFFEKKEFFENCLNQEKQTKEKQLLLLKKDLDSKKNIVQDYVGDDLLKKRTIINNLLLGQMQTELNKTRENNFWDLEHELEKEKIKINEYEELKKELEISQKEKNVNKTKENHI